jgi:xanthine dehydrogenase accessory factor
MDIKTELSKIKVCVKGGGDIASGVAWRLHQCGFCVYITEIQHPMAVRRKVSFCEAVYDGHMVVEGVEALLIRDVRDVYFAWEENKIPVIVDPMCESRHLIEPDVIIDGILAKKNTGTSINDAPVTIALGPGFAAGRDAHFVVETNRGHYLGRLLTKGSAQPDTGTPGPVQGITTDRVLRAPADGQWQTKLQIGDLVKKGDVMGAVSGVDVNAMIDGVLRGLIRPGIQVNKGLKIGDIDPRGIREHCNSISDKALAIGGGVLEGILWYYGFAKNKRPSKPSH